jgi:hypothetical protein
LPIATVEKPSRSNSSKLHNTHTKIRKMSDSPSFALLSTKLPADTLALKLLGRMVEDIKQPTNGPRTLARCSKLSRSK